MGWLFLMINLFGLGNPFTWFFTVLAARKLEDKSALAPRTGARKLTLPPGLKKPLASRDDDDDSSGEVPAIPQVKLPSGGPTKPVAGGGLPSMKANLPGGGPKRPGMKDTAVTTTFPRGSNDSDATEILGRKALEVKVKVRCGMCGKGFAGPKRVVDALRACPKCGADPLSFEFL
jgi:hypothetical protein